MAQRRRRGDHLRSTLDEDERVRLRSASCSSTDNNKDEPVPPSPEHAEPPAGWFTSWRGTSDTTTTTTTSAQPQRLSGWWSQGKLKADDDAPSLDSTSTPDDTSTPAQKTTPESRTLKMSSWWAGSESGQDDGKADTEERVAPMSPVMERTETLPPTTGSQIAGALTTVAGGALSVATTVVGGTVRAASGVVAGGVVGGVPGAVGGLASAAVGVAVGGAISVATVTAKAGASATGAVVRGIAGAATGATKPPQGGTPVLDDATTEPGRPTDAKQNLKCSECAALFSYRCWRYECPACQESFCSACLTNAQKHRVPRKQLHEPVAVCRGCFFTTCIACCGGKCFSEWPVADLRSFMESRGIESTALEKHELVRSICDWGKVQRIGGGLKSGFSQPRGQGLDHLTVSQLKEILTMNGINHSHCVEKSELISLVRSEL